MSTESTSQDGSLVGRGDFLRQLAALVAAAPFGLPSSAGVQPGASAAPRRVPVAPPDNLVGIQMGAHTMLDEGIEHALDLCQ